MTITYKLIDLDYPEFLLTFIINDMAIEDHKRIEEKIRELKNYNELKFEHKDNNIVEITYKKKTVGV